MQLINFMKKATLFTASAAVLLSVLSTGSSNAQLAPLNNADCNTAQSFVQLTKEAKNWSGGAFVPAKNGNKQFVKIDAQFDGHATKGRCKLTFGEIAAEPSFALSPAAQTMENIPFEIRYEDDATKGSHNNVFLCLIFNSGNIDVVNCGSIDNLTWSGLHGTFRADADRSFWLGPKFSSVKEERTIKQKLRRLYN